MNQLHAAAATHHPPRGHGRIDAAHVVPIAADAVAISDWANATVGASAEEIDRDVAAGIVLTATVAGNDRAVELAMAHVGEQGMLAADSYVQKAALTADLRRSAKAAGVDCDALRESVAQRAGQPAPERSGEIG